MLLISGFVFAGFSDFISRFSSNDNMITGFGTLGRFDDDFKDPGGGGLDGDGDDPPLPDCYAPTFCDGGDCCTPINPVYTLTTCPTGYVLKEDNDFDCDDSDDTINPDTVWYKDEDGDGYSTGDTIPQCTKPTDYVLGSELETLPVIGNPNTIDCADDDSGCGANCHPPVDRDEVCDVTEYDEDCDGLINGWSNDFGTGLGSYTAYDEYDDCGADVCEGITTRYCLNTDDGDGWSDWSDCSTSGDDAGICAVCGDSGNFDYAGNQVTTDCSICADDADICVGYDSDSCSRSCPNSGSYPYVCTGTFCDCTDDSDCDLTNPPDGFDNYTCVDNNPDTCEPCLNYYWDGDGDGHYVSAASDFRCWSGTPDGGPGTYSVLSTSNLGGDCDDTSPCRTTMVPSSRGGGGNEFAACFLECSLGSADESTCNAVKPACLCVWDNSGANGECPLNPTLCSKSSSDCPICINEAATEVCDGVKNDCNSGGGIDYLPGQDSETCGSGICSNDPLGSLIQATRSRTCNSVLPGAGWTDWGECSTNTDDAGICSVCNFTGDPVFADTPGDGRDGSDCLLDSNEFPFIDNYADPFVSCSRSCVDGGSSPYSCSDPVCSCSTPGDDADCSSGYTCVAGSPNTCQSCTTYYADYDQDGYYNFATDDHDCLITPAFPYTSVSTNSGDCDDIPDDDPEGISCPTIPADCDNLVYPEYSACAICINSDATEVCDGYNNDCNGVDQTLPDQTTSCGDGVCSTDVNGVTSSTRDRTCNSVLPGAGWNPWLACSSSGKDAGVCSVCNFDGALGFADTPGDGREGSDCRISADDFSYVANYSDPFVSCPRSCVDGGSSPYSCSDPICECPNGLASECANGFACVNRGLVNHCEACVDYYWDGDGDGFYENDALSVCSISRPDPDPVNGAYSALLADSGDCADNPLDDVVVGCPLDPTDPANCDESFSSCAICINPDATEYCDGYNNDCDGEYNNDVDDESEPCGSGVCEGTRSRSCTPSAAPDTGWNNWTPCNPTTGITDLTCGDCSILGEPTYDGDQDDDCDDIPVADGYLAASCHNDCDDSDLVAPFSCAGTVCSCVDVNDCDNSDPADPYTCASDNTCRSCTVYYSDIDNDGYYVGDASSECLAEIDFDASGEFTGIEGNVGDCLESGTYDGIDADDIYVGTTAPYTCNPGEIFCEYESIETCASDSLWSPPTCNNDGAETLYKDGDGDGFGDSLTAPSTGHCTYMTDYYTSTDLSDNIANDCDDTLVDVNPGVGSESGLCSGNLDDDCDGVSFAGYADDGYCSNKTDYCDLEDCPIDDLTVDVFHLNGDSYIPDSSDYVCVNQKFQVNCSSSLIDLSEVGFGVNEGSYVSVSVIGGSCVYDDWVGPNEDVVRFNCSYPSTTSVDISCSFSPPAYSSAVTVTSSVIFGDIDCCGAYVGESACESDNNCEYCPRCDTGGSMKNNSLVAGDSCVIKGDCTYSVCDTSCGAECNSDDYFPLLCADNYTGCYDKTQGHLLGIHYPSDDSDDFTDYVVGFEGYRLYVDDVAGNSNLDCTDTCTIPDHTSNYENCSGLYSTPSPDDDNDLYDALCECNDTTDACEFPGQVWYDDSDGDAYYERGTSLETACGIEDITNYNAVGRDWVPSFDNTVADTCLLNVTPLGGDDCADTDFDVNVGLPEVCDGLVDEDCNGLVDEGLFDVNGDLDMATGLPGYCVDGVSNCGGNLDCSVWTHDACPLDLGCSQLSIAGYCNATNAAGDWFDDAGYSCYQDGTCGSDDCIVADGEVEHGRFCVGSPSCSQFDNNLVDTGCDSFTGCTWNAYVAGLYPYHNRSNSTNSDGSPKPLPYSACADAGYNWYCPGDNVKEVCSDGIDNDHDDGFGNPDDDPLTGIDCADSDCYGSGSWSSEEVANANCLGSDQTGEVDSSHYCASDPSLDVGVGLCCPVNWYLAEDFGVWTCYETDVCYKPGEVDECNVKYEDDYSSWLADPDCVNPSAPSACCSIVQFGSLDYFSDADNVRTY